MTKPEAAVAIATRDRPVRLRWLLNALSEQTLPADRFEVLVAYDPASKATEQLLRTHPLRGSGRLRDVRFPQHSAFPGAGRNAAWRAARAPLILFTDDDCRPAADWIARAVVRAKAHAGAIVQGRTLPEPDEALVLRGAPWARTQVISPPTPWAQTCNIAYPRSVLERAGGFEERPRVGEDADLALRARAMGVPLVAASEMLVYHAVEARSLARALRAATDWEDIAWLAKRHPEVRRSMWGGIWWKREHAALAAAIASAVMTGRDRRAAIMALPWLTLSLRHRGYSARGILRSITELPGRAALDATETVTMLRGSVRHRTLLL